MSCQHCKPQGARKLHDADVVYLYDGSFEAFCAAYVELCPARLPFAVWTPQRRLPPLPGHETTDPPLPAGYLPALAKSWAQRPEYLVSRDFSPAGRTRSCCCPLSLHPGLLRWVRHGQAGGVPGGRALYAMKKSLDWEVDKFQGFVRFESTTGCWARSSTKIYPPPASPGTLQTLSEEDFMIYDAVHQAVLLHEKHGTRLWNWQRL